MATEDGVSLWQDHALCGGTETEIFFGDDRQSQNYAKRLCNGCPVKSICLDFAIIYNMHGVWGGTTERERRRITNFRVQMLRDDYIESGLYNSKLKV
jgi:WhiB family redox-sensing transcriptional regulator